MDDLIMDSDELSTDQGMVASNSIVLSWINLGEGTADQDP